MENEEVARVVAEAIVSVNPELLYVALAGAKGELMRRIGEEVGLKVVYEAFPDRAYTPEGTLLSRRQPGAVIKDPREVSERAAADGKRRCCYRGGRNHHSARSPNPVRPRRYTHGGGSCQKHPPNDGSRRGGGNTHGKGMRASMPVGLFEKARFRTAGDRGLLVEYGDIIDPDVNNKVRSMAMVMEQNAPEGVTEVIPTYRSLLIVYDPSSTNPAKLAKNP